MRVEEVLTDELTEARVRIIALERALKPFAQLGVIMLPVDADDDSPWVTAPDQTVVNNVERYGFTFGHFRQAARLVPLLDEEMEDKF